MKDTKPRIEDLEIDHKGHNLDSTQSAHLKGNPVSLRRPSGPSTQRKQKSKSSAHQSTKVVVTGQETTKAQHGRKTGAWTKAEMKALWDALGLLPVGAVSYTTHLHTSYFHFTS